MRCPEHSSKRPFLNLVTLLLLALSLPLRAVENFPTPAELVPDVAFWTRVYTEVDTKSGFIHDAYDLSIVYETLKLSGDRRSDERTIRDAKNRYVDILKRLASSRENLSSEEQRVLALWGPDSSDRRLQAGAANLRFQRGQSDRFRDGLARSGEWYSYIETVLAEHQLPRELAALPHVESSFNPQAYSSVGAAGIWQFTRSTGRRYLHIDYVVDERMDPFAATRGAAQLLKHNYQLTGSWPLAITAYNHGASGMRRASKQLGTTDIDTIVRNYKGRAFGFASRNFYVSFLAAVEVSENSERYFKPYNQTRPTRYAEVALPDYVLVDSFARAFGTELDELKQHNRALLEPVWLGKKRIPRGYTVRLPSQELAADPEILLAAIPADERFSEQTPDLFHKVVPGDTVSEIATRYGHSIRDVAAMNGLNRRYQIRVGQVLRLPLEGAIVTAEVSPSPSPETQHATVSEVEEEPVLLASQDQQEEDPIIEIDPDMLADPSDYTVAENGSIEIQATETLGHYAEWLDLRASDLRRLNGIPYGRALVIGHRLKLDFARVQKGEFERRRLAYQYDLQQSFFMTWQISSTRRHVIAPGDSLWVLTQREFKIPMWLLRQYNPDLDLDKLHPGTVVLIPELVEA